MEMFRNSGNTDITEEPGDKIAKDDGLIRFVVAGRARDARKVPEVPLPLVQARIRAAGVEQEYVGVALDQPTTVEGLDALCAH
jgi:hypothetical protein